ncbi:hypothetical protein A2866_00470 [Candidatus Roizmanbacteria bacterium RIFCSPHIGHO2_01_FULL_39_8]|uniref:dTDP-4-dehydrorhamnose reductase n=3 Tax=Candidatus Roizmaniibacteriota TaxID=1752723 RepID=A0A1F7GGE8_9BACT|nr:MAG: hypothetical protein A2866_00470 [Candidatus Roizmanbacteria bacterium RIFCSPHIGHO2_01_FULL_39_8]OGK28141.1 MAG: hypothetical protein A3C28_05585 [Candidatus Roizmanbacteria bacterium RIFCSPHIGHO2_02_FULL_39_9]OGK37061.1 MAG: hypothetical protein A3F60_02355 [Candidatus Roizmanbacteria bacterium RIFCSPHIGHO2_12_FULL_39_8]
MVNIAITGSKGLIGSRIVELLKGDFTFIELELPDFDITNRDKVTEVISKIDFDIFFHLAAYTNVDQAEKEKKLCHHINVEGTNIILDAVLKKKKKFIFVSTDFVFDGKKHDPYFEDSIPYPLSYYAKTKYEGEQLVKNSSMIVRFSYPYRSTHPAKPDFVKRIKQVLVEKKEIRLMSDSIMTPTFIDDIAYSMKYLFLHFSPQIFHVVGQDSFSPFTIGKMIARTFHLDESLIIPTTFSQYSEGKAQRSQYSDIRSKKNNFHKMKKFQDGLDEVAKQLRNL